MNKWMALTKIQLKDFMSKYTQQLNVKGKFLGRLMLILPLLILLPAVEVERQLYLTFKAIGMPELLLTYMYVGTTMMVFLSALPLVVSVFFYSKDLALIATLPVKEDTVVFSKIASIYVYLLGVATLLFGIAVGLYGLGDGLNIQAILMGLIGLLFTPIIPMIFAILVVIPFMTYIGGKKHRNLMVIIGNVLFIVIILGLQVALTRIEMNPDAVMKYFSDSDGLIAFFGHKFPPSVWLTKMIKGSFLDTVYYILLNVLFFILLKVSAKFIYKGALTKYNQENVSSTSTKHKVLRYEIRSKRILLIKRHIGIIVHNPTFLLNTIFSIFVPLILFGIYTAMGIMSLDSFKDPSLQPYLIYIFTGIISAPVLMGSISATVISREGKAFWETRVLPISATENLMTRMLSSVIINGGATLILALVTAWAIPIGTLDFIIALVTAIIATLAFSTIDLLINIQRPYLNWSNPTAAVKNNLNVMIAFVPRLLFATLGYILFKVVPGASAQFMVAIFGLILLIFFVLAYALMFGRYRIKFIEIDA